MINVSKPSQVPVPLEDCRDVYIFGMDEGIPFPRACIELDCPATGRDLSLDIAMANADIIPASGQLEFIPIDRSNPAQQLQKNSLEVTKKIAAGARLGECAICPLFEKCWQRDTEVGQEAQEVVK